MITGALFGIHKRKMYWIFGIHILCVFDTLKETAFFTLKDNMCLVKSHSIFLTFLQKKKNLTRQHDRHVCT